MQWLMTVSLAVTLLLSASAQAQRSASPRGDADVRLVFDVSGSMKRNDPERLSGSALELFVGLLPSGAQGGLWTFGSEVDNPLPPAPVDDAWREQALALKPALAAYQQYTDIEAAIRRAADAEPTSGPRHVILLTDGMVDIPGGADKAARDAASRRRLIEELAPRLRDEGVVVDAIAFSAHADRDLLETLARRTGGLATVAEDPDALLRALMDVVERIFPRDQVPLAQGRFPIDKTVDGFSALLFHDPGSPAPTLVAPDGQRYSVDVHPGSIRWQHQPRFDIIHVPSPNAGEWRIEGEVGPDSRVSVDSPLALRTGPLPATLYQGFETPIEARVTTPDGAVPESPLALRAELRDIDGTLRQSVALAEEGDLYRGVLPAPQVTGNARLVVVARNDELVRERRQAVNILAPIHARVAEDGKRVLLRAEHPRLNADNTQLSATLQGDSLPVVETGATSWRIDLPTLDTDVSVPLTVTADMTLNGRTHHVILPVIRLNPGASTRLDGASLDRPPGRAEVLAPAPGTDAETPTDAARGPAATVNDWLAHLPDEAQALWQAVPPRLRHYVQQRRDDPLAWVVWGVLLLILVLGVYAWRRARARRRPVKREEPHV
ncbi:VWA domain-containing protein [Modicisalibacter tunisiensis]|uniref:VWA domain-containing protein n=1 Tax=Modicisalibacter tunisiensis TaxID=390637 RepID=A0ABS7X2M8_9GAMM|nr:vWA domain-containing protein [Modicisalibacter tunisiensis]MBZ9568830.1 VWA domain-containing protein [Modicisalibacter tunisiensis]